jgi:DNA repair exonuclease SbcCD ATPase subunit
MNILRDIEGRRKRQREDSAQLQASLVEVEEEEISVDDVPEIDIDFHDELPEIDPEEAQIQQAENRHFEETIGALQSTLEARDNEIEELKKELQETKEELSQLREKLQSSEEEKTLENPEPTVSQFREGVTATNPQTGEKITFRDGKWVPVND